MSANTLNPASQVIRGISSKATQQLLAALCTAFEAQTGQAVHIESVGGVDAARRVAAGEHFDVVLLASDAIDKLIEGGHLAAGSRVDYVQSPVAVAVHQSSPAPDIGSEAALMAAVLAAPSISYSTGPSGTYLKQLFERWGIAEQVAAKLVVPPPGTPVAALIASGQVGLGFQQRSELLNVDGVQIVGDLPDAVAFITTFSAGVTDGHLPKVLGFLEFLNNLNTKPIKFLQGMLTM